MKSVGEHGGWEGLEEQKVTTIGKATMAGEARSYQRQPVQNTGLAGVARAKHRAAGGNPATSAKFPPQMKQ